MQKNIFIAIGGQGTKVAEALIRLVVMGFPTKKGRMDDDLTIWRVDPDKAAAAWVSLKDLAEKTCAPLGNDPVLRNWAMRINPLRNLDPTEIACAKDLEQTTLRDLLDTNPQAKPGSKQVLKLFFKEPDLDMKVTKGFNQKPFIGSAVMRVSAEGLRRSSAQKEEDAKVNITELYNNRIRFFLCGSLYGGTGASGVPNLAHFIRALMKEKPDQTKDWSIGCCLLAPYQRPPAPPFDPDRRYEPGPELDGAVEAKFKEYAEHAAFAGKSDEDKRHLIRQIFLGQFADHESVMERAQQALQYYQKVSAASPFDRTYLVGKPHVEVMDGVWANDGQRQNNKPNSGETVGALCALEFFSCKDGAVKTEGYRVPSGTSSTDPSRLRLYDLPRYQTADGTEVDPERAVLATAILSLFLRKLPWEETAQSAGWKNFLGERYQGQKADQGAEEASIQGHFLEVVRKAAAGTFGDESQEGEKQTLAERMKWNVSVCRGLRPFFDPTDDEREAALAKSAFSSKAKVPSVLGQTQIRVSTDEIYEWNPLDEKWAKEAQGLGWNDERDLGGYLRFLWWKIYLKDI